MKQIRPFLLAFTAIVLIVTLGLTEQDGLAESYITTSFSPILTTPTPMATEQPVGGDIPALTYGQPVHMPDLLGRSLDYAISIWDSDEALPQIRVVGPTNDPSLVVVAQQPAPGTLIVPGQTTIMLTMGNEQIQQPLSSPTPEPPSSLVAAGQATLLRLPYVQNLTTNSVTIVRTTKEDAASEVYYGIGGYSWIAPASSTYFTTPSAAPYDRYYVHQATINGLTADTVYQYRIYTNAVDLTPGSLVAFRTAKPSTTTSFRFAIFGDSGDGSQDQKDVATRLLQVQPDLVLHAGDLIYPEASYGLFESNFFQIYKNLQKSVWIAPSMGNKDVMYNNGKSFTDVFVNPPNATKANEKELYYSFDYGNAHFTVLNNYFSMATVGSAQYNWLVNDLSTSNQFWKFVVFHEPPYTTNTNQQPNDNSAIVKNLVPLFEKYKVDIVFSGHYHYYERMYPMVGGKVSTIASGGVVYVVTGGGGAGLGSVGTGTLNPRTAAKFQKFHLTMIDINGCSLWLSAVQRVSSSTDTFDPSDIFDTYSINRCGEPISTPVPTYSKDSVGVFRPSNGVIYLKNSNTSGFADIALNYGIRGDYPVTGDWDGDGADTIGVYRNGVFYLRNSNTVGYADLTFPFGLPGDQPIAGDWNGDGKDTIGVYRSSTFTFYLRNSNTSGPPDYVFQLGIPGDIGIAGDWNGDGKDTVGVFRPSNGMIFLKNKNETGIAEIAINYGMAGDQPVTGDWNNDRIDTIGVLRGNMFYLRNSNSVGYADISFALGNSGDMPIAGDWDGKP